MHTPDNEHRRSQQEGTSHNDIQPPAQTSSVNKRALIFDIELSTALYSLKLPQRHL